MLERACGFESHSRHQLGTLERRYTRETRGDVAKRPKAGVCKTSIRRFESARRLQSSTLLDNDPGFPDHGDMCHAE